MPKTRAKDRKHKTRPDGQRCAKPKVKYMVHGLKGNFMKDPLDRRTRVGKAYNEHKALLRHHLGGDLTLPQESLIDQVARFAVLQQITWHGLMEIGVVAKDGSVSPCLDAFAKVAKEERALLILLGLKRKTKTLSLEDVLQGKTETIEEK